MSKTGVIIANTGSPVAATPEAVHAYLREFLMDPRICPMPPAIWKIILNAFILPKRSVASAEKYAGIWQEDGSPLSVTMQSLARKLDAACGDGFEVRHAMSHGEPSVADVLEDLQAIGCDNLVVIPLYPQSALSTSSVVKDKVEAALSKTKWQPSVRFVESYGNRDDYLSAVADSVKQAGFREGDRLLMAFHSIPMRDIGQGDSYAEQVIDTTSGIARRLGLDDDQWVVGFQCRFDKSRSWLGPFTNEAIDALGEGHERLFVVAPNFSIDCLETLYDIEVELRERLASSQKDVELVYVPCLNDSPAQVELLRKIAIDA